MQSRNESWLLLGRDELKKPEYDDDDELLDVVCELELLENEENHPELFELEVLEVLDVTVPVAEEPNIEDCEL